MDTVPITLKNNFRATMDTILDNIHEYGYAVIEDAFPEGV
ncbi:MAG: hypothetical protein ACI9LG_002046, partial [Moritella dasanensis]